MILSWTVVICSILLYPHTIPKNTIISMSTRLCFLHLSIRSSFIASNVSCNVIPSTRTTLYHNFCFFKYPCLRKFYNAESLVPLFLSFLLGNRFLRCMSTKRQQLSGYYGILVHAYNSLCGMVLYSNLTIPRITDVKKFSHYLGLV